MPLGNASFSKNFNYNKRFSYEGENLPLDQYKNNVVAGFSYYKLLSSYKGNCVRVRRSSDNAEADFGFVKKKYTNLAMSATVTSSTDISNKPYVNDNDLTGANFTALGVPGSQWLKFDLGAIYNISKINLWHYYVGGRIYYDTIIQISNDNVNWTNLFNNDSDNSSGQGIGTDAEYAETIAGKKLDVNQNARYVRFWSNGNNANTYNHYHEVEILTRTNEWYIDIDSLLAFCGTGNGFVKTWYNQYNGGNNAIQTTSGNQPQIVSNGLFKWDGIYFSGSNSYFLTVTAYSLLDILSPIHSFYLNHYTTTAQNSFLFAKSTQYCCLYNNVTGNLIHFIRLGDTTNRCQFTLSTSTTNKTLFMWSNKDANGLIGNNNGSQVLDTKNSDITSVTADITIGQRGGTAYLTGNIKSFIILNNTIEYNIISQI